MFNSDQFKIRVATAAMSVAVSLAAPSLAVLAATGTVTGDSINVRSDASTTSSIVGTANNGDVLEVGDSKDDDSGNTWYQVTLDDGSTGYIRYDFIEVTEDEEPEEAATEETPAEADTQDDTESDTTSSAGITQTGDYQVVLAPDDDGNDIYYLYNNAKGERMKISDIEALQTRVLEAENNVSSIGSRYRIIVVALVVLLILAIVLCVTLFLRLRDAMSSGHRERDLTRDRANERKRGGGADDLSAVKRRTREDRRGEGASSRSNAYASGTRRRPAADGARADRDDRRGGDDYSRVREGARPVRTANDASRETTRRPVSDEQRRTSTGEPRRVRPARPEGDEDVRTTRPRAERVRTSSSDSSAQSAPRASASQNTSPARATRPQAKNFADDDDDFDYGFISLDDK